MAYLHAKFHLDPSNRLATIHQRDRQNRQTGQRSDSIGRTVLQRVARKQRERATTIYNTYIGCRLSFDLINAVIGHVQLPDDVIELPLSLHTN